MESFWGTRKNELVHHRHDDTRAQAIREITEYIEIFDNRQRRRSRLAIYPRQRVSNSGPVSSRRHEAVTHVVHY